MLRSALLFLVSFFILISCSSRSWMDYNGAHTSTLVVDKTRYKERLEGFWLGQSIANWTGLVTEMDKIGGDGPQGEFYTRDDWGKRDQPSIWGEGVPSRLSSTIDWVFEDEYGHWGADDDTDIEYLYLHLLTKHKSIYLTPLQIQKGWLKHIYSDDNTPFVNKKGEKENYLWVSNQQAFDLMQKGMLPPATSNPAYNPHYDMIDAQLTTEIFGLFAPGRPDVALKMAELPITTTAREDARWAAEFYVVMYSLAASLTPENANSENIRKLANLARTRLPEASYVAKMYDFVAQKYDEGLTWEATRDAVYQRYQVEQQDGYDMSSRGLYCNGCFASGINFAASIISLLYGGGDYQDTVKIAVLTGWDADNPAATWGGMLGFIYGKPALEAQFKREFSSIFNIHRTRGNFANDGLDSFERMATKGMRISERVLKTIPGTSLTDSHWRIPLATPPVATAVLPAGYRQHRSVTNAPLGN